MSDVTDIQPLHGILLGLSSSEAPMDADRGRGLTTREFLRANMAVAEAVLSQGGRLAFGHGWRHDGLMPAAVEFATRYDPRFAPVHADRDAGKPLAETTRLITSVVPWPMTTTLSDAEYDQVKHLLVIHEMRRTDWGRAYSAEYGDNFPTAPYAAALTRTRHHLADLCHARLCFGGAVENSSGRYAGVAEEAAITLQHGKPLYLTALYGGASAVVAREILGVPQPQHTVFAARPDVAAALADHDPDPARAVDAAIFAQTGLDGLAALNGLSAQENERMINAVNLSEVIGFLLLGLARLRAAHKI